MTELPHNLNAEKSVLSAMMVERYCALMGCDKLRADDFYGREDRIIFDAMERLVRADRPVDFTTLTDLLEVEKTMESAGGVDYVNEISTFVPSTLHLQDYIDIVKRTSGQRKAYEAAKDIAILSKSGEVDPFDLCSKAHTLFANIDTDADDDCPIITAKELMQQSRARREKGVVGRIKTGWKRVDNICPIEKTNLIIIAGRPGMGKSVLAEEIGLFTAAQGHRVMFASLEMPAHETANRLLSKQAFVPLMFIRNGMLAGDDQEAIDDADDHISSLPWSLIDKPAITPQRLFLKLKAMPENKRPELLIIDYLQIMNPGKDLKGDTRAETIGNMTRFFKIMARDLNMAIILVSQINRANAERQNKRPTLSDLRESGAIEQDADIVWFVHREGYYADDGNLKSDDNDAELDIKKNRNGPSPMIIRLEWFPEMVSLREKQSAA